jgi:hypothetical protein
VLQLALVFLVRLAPIVRVERELMAGSKTPQDVVRGYCPVLNGQELVGTTQRIRMATEADPNRLFFVSQN